MECPKCKHVQADGREECAQCGVIFARIPKAADLAPPPEYQNAAYVDGGAENLDVAVTRVAGPAPTWLLFVFVALLCGLAWWLNFPSSPPPVSGAWKDEERGFSLKPPTDWIALNKSNYDTLVQQHKGRFPSHLQQYLRSPNFVVGFFKLSGREDEIPPSINVIAQPLPKPLPPLDEKQKAEATEAITGQVAKLIDSYRLQSSEIVRADGQPALQLTSTAAIRLVLSPRAPIMSEPGAFGMRHVVGYSEEVAKDVEFKSIQTLVPAKEWAYILSCSFEKGEVDLTMSVCQATLDSFRVGKRPPRFGPVMMGSLNGGLLAAIGYVLFILLARTFKRDD